MNVDVQSRLLYVDGLELSSKELAKFAEELVQPVVQRSRVNKSFEGDFNHVIRVSYKPGVMDPVGRSAKLLAETVLDQQWPFEKRVSAQGLKFIKSEQPLTETQLRKIAGLFSNDTVQKFDVFTADQWSAGVEPYMPTVVVPPPEPVQHYGLSDMSGSEMLDLSKERSLALNDLEMQTIRNYYRQQIIIADRKKVGLTEKATDVELELLGQTWSEHCKHKIFNADVTYVDENGLETRIEEGIFSRFIKKSTMALKEQKPDFIKSVLWDNSGVVDLDPSLENYVCFKVETHNSPSFMEPYGGAITGIVGVYRDPMGTGRGSKLIFGVWGYCTGSTFYDGDLRPPLHPDQLLMGIHWGDRDGGNKHGVPNAGGDAFYHAGYMGKCLVFVGAGATIPKDVDGTPGYEKWVDPGDRIIVVGGRVGKDGIHGATASSLEYSENTPAGHVQIGDPYTQKNVQEFLLEALEAGLINFAQDSGAGGTASAAGEMATFSNGATVQLDSDLFKYTGLASWEKLVSESQERMFLAVNPNKLEQLVDLAEKWSVEWRDIGEFNDSGYFHVKDKDETVCYLDMDFLHDGAPQKKLKAVWQSPEQRGLQEPSLESRLNQDQTEILHKILKRENIASKEFLQREYDSRVQGRTVIPPFIGEKSDVRSDGTVQRVEYDSDVGIAIGTGLNPSLSKIDTYHMAQYSANEGLMRVVAVGADPDKAANNGNYCWPGVLPDEAPDAEYKMAQLVRAAQGQHDFAMATGDATISGKDSMKIQGKIKDKDGNVHKIYGLPSLQFATIATVPDIKKSQTSDFKVEGDLIYLVGLETKNELGASEFYDMIGETGANVPQVDLERSMEAYRALHQAMQQEYVESAKICGRGGLAVALSQAAFAGGLGAAIDLASVPTDIDPEDAHLAAKLLYSESASRFIVTVMPENAEAFEKAMGQYAAQIGQVTKENLEVRLGDREIINDHNQNFKKSWQSTFKHKNYHQERKSA